MNSDWLGDTHPGMVATYRSRRAVAADEQRLAVEMARALEDDSIERAALAFPLPRRSAATLVAAAEHRLAALNVLDRQLDHFRHVPVVDAIFGAVRIAPLAPNPDHEHTVPVEPRDPVAYPELSILPSVPVLRGTLRLIIGTCRRSRPPAERLDIEPPLACSPRRMPGYVSLAEAAKRTSPLREGLYRCECFQQESLWERQVADLSEIIDCLEPRARERTLDYMVVCTRLAAAFQLLATNRGAGFLAWSRACLRWIWLYLADLADWIERHAEGRDRADGTDFPFADLLNKSPDFLDIPKPAEYRDCQGR
ncbi:MAG TPA: hypothetical protein VF444_21360 [Pseudonocardiaceae bacterium]